MKISQLSFIRLSAVFLVSGWVWANEAVHEPAQVLKWKPATLRVALADKPAGDIARGKTKCCWIISRVCAVKMSAAS